MGGLGSGILRAVLGDQPRDTLRFELGFRKCSQNAAER